MAEEDLQAGNFYRSLLVVAQAIGEVTVVGPGRHEDRGLRGVGEIAEGKGSEDAGEDRAEGGVEVLRVESARILEDQGLIGRVIERGHGNKGGLVPLRKLRPNE